MTWLIVVGVVVAVALAVHFGEERKSRAAIQARKARAAKPGRISHTRRVNETWDIDLEAMVAVVTRVDDKGTPEAPAQFRLLRNSDGSFSLEPSADPPRALPQAVAELLTQPKR